MRAADPRPGCWGALCAGGRPLGPRGATGRVGTRLPAISPSGPPGPRGVPEAADKPGILLGGGCTGARTENPRSTPIGVTASAHASDPDLPPVEEWGGRHGRGPQAGRAGDPEADQVMHLQPAWAPKLQPASVCRQQLPGNPRARPHSPYLRTGARRPSGCGQARRSALRRQHRRGNRPSAPSPVAAEGSRLEVPSSGRAGAGGGRAWRALRPGALAIQRPPRPCSTTWAPKVQAPSTCWRQLPGNSQAGWRSQPRRTGARCRRGCGQARRSAPRQLRRGGNQTPAPSAVAAEGPRQLPRSLFRGGAGGSHGQRALRPEGMHACDSGTSRPSPGEPASQRRLRPSCSSPLPAMRAWERLPESRLALTCRRAPNGFAWLRESERSER
uniref:Uncharacterized protein n=1 Tax=Macaca fascicularis TaxID=9541 RepID=A0A7N9CKK2_MACFA